MQSLLHIEYHSSTRIKLGHIRHILRKSIQFSSYEWGIQFSMFNCASSMPKHAERNNKGPDELSGPYWLERMQTYLSR